MPADNLFSIRGAVKDQWIYVLFGLAVILRIVYFLEVKNTPVLEFLYIDSEYYHQWAIRIAAGDWLGGQRTFFMAPFYAYFLALIYFFSGPSFVHALIVQILIGSFSCVLLYLIARKYFNRLTAIIAGLIAAVYPIFIFYDTQILKENLMVFFLLFFALCYPLPENSSQAPVKIKLKGNKSDSCSGFGGQAADKKFAVTGQLVASGIFIGINSLMRPNIFLLLPFLLVWEYFHNIRAIFFKRMLIFIAGIAITVFPVALRNKIVGGEWVLTVAAGGMNFWTGNNPAAQGAYIGADFITSEEPDYEEEDFRREASRRSGRELTVKESSNFWYRQAFDFILQNPRRFLYLLWRKFIGFWHNTELPSDLNFYFARDFSYLLRYDFLTFGFIAPFAVIGMFLSRKKNKANFFFYSIIFYNLVSSLIFFNSSRYRLPVIPFFVLYAGFYCSELYQLSFSGKIIAQKNKLVNLILLTVPFFLLANYPDPLLKRISSIRVSYLNTANYYLNKNNYGRAEAMLKKCLEIDPAYALAYEKYAGLLKKIGRTKEAEECLGQALHYAGVTNDARFTRSLSEEQSACLLFNQKKYNEALAGFLEILKKNPDQEKELRNNMGLCYLRLNDYPQAEKEFKKSLSIDKNYDKAYYNLGLVYEKIGNIQKALNSFKKAAALNPSYLKAQQKVKLYEKGPE